MFPLANRSFLSQLNTLESKSTYRKKFIRARFSSLNFSTCKNSFAMSGFSIVIPGGVLQFWHSIQLICSMKICRNHLIVFAARPRWIQLQNSIEHARWIHDVVIIIALLPCFQEGCSTTSPNYSLLSTHYHCTSLNHTSYIGLMTWLSQFQDQSRIMVNRNLPNF